MKKVSELFDLDTPEGMEKAAALEARREKKALERLMKESTPADFNPFYEDDRASPFSDIQDVNGTFAGTW